MRCTKLAVYSPEDVQVMVGVSKVEGFSIDSVVGISKVSNVYTPKINADGTVSRTHNGNNVINVSVSLSNASEWNQIFTYMSLLDRTLQMGKFPLMIKDDQGSSLLVSPSTWIEKVPDTNFTTSIENRDWVLCCSHAILNVGGNFKEGSAAMDVINTLAGGAAGSGILNAIL